MQSIKKYNDLDHKRVLLRVDFNVPLADGKITDETKIRAALPTITYLLERKAKVIIISHLGRPAGKVVKSLSTEPLARRLSRLCPARVRWLGASSGTAVRRAIDTMKPGSILFLENIQFNQGEQKNDPRFAAQLAALADVFVLEAFGQAHRSYASLVGVQALLPGYLGLRYALELQALNRLRESPRHPFVAALGGAKIATKLPVLKQLTRSTDHILLGGALINTYLYARGYGVGASLKDVQYAKTALKYCRSAKVVKPLDVVVGDMAGKAHRVVPLQKKPHHICADHEYILDIGPETIQDFSAFIARANTLVWNGAMGYFEQEPYHIGTAAIATLIAERAGKKSVYAVAGGGETIATINQFADPDAFNLVSTGGGAMLAYLAGEKLAHER